MVEGSLGRGGFGAVYAVRDITEDAVEGARFAAKVEPWRRSASQSLLVEAMMFARLQQQRDEMELTGRKEELYLFVPAVHAIGVAYSEKINNCTLLPTNVSFLQLSSTESQQLPMFYGGQ